MTPVHRIAREMAEAEIMRKLNRNEYRRWQENMEAARKRAEELRKR